MSDELRPDWEGMRDRFIGLDESFSVKSYYPQLMQRLKELEESREFLEQKSAALINLLEDLEEERKKAKESEARLQAVFKNLPFAFWSADENGVVQLANELARNLYGMEAGYELDALPVDDRTRELLKRDFSAAASEGLQKNERYSIGESGERRWVQAVAAPITVDGTVRGVLGADIDITKLKEAEASLASLNEELETKVLERTEQLRAKIGELNDAQDRLILSEKLAALGRLTAGIAHELNSPLGAIESSSVLLIDNVMRSASALPVLFSRLPKEAVAVYFSLLSDSMDYASRLGEGGDRKRRRELSSRLSALGSEKPDYLAELVDEINGYEAFDAIVEHFGLETAEVIFSAASGGAALVRSSTIIRHAAERAALVVKALKSFEGGDAADSASGSRRSGAECEDGYQSLWAEVDVDRTIAAAVELYRSRFRHGVQLDLRLESHAFVCANEASLSQVWINLVSNALQAMEYRGRLEISALRDGERAVIRVIDSGCGIAEENKSRIFMPFFTTKAVGEGTGFGLVVAKRVIERTGGKIEFESRPGRTEFRVILPASEFKGGAS